MSDNLPTCEHCKKNSARIVTLIGDDKKAQRMIGRVCDDCQHLICGFDMPFIEKMHLMALRPIKFTR
jgi:protein-arginine kinase activator protein McsA